MRRLLILLVFILFTGIAKAQRNGCEPVVHNVRYAHCFPGDNAGEKTRAAIADLPSYGGTVDLRGFSILEDIIGPLFINKKITFLGGNTKFRLTCPACARDTAAIVIGRSINFLGMSGQIRYGVTPSGTVFEVSTSMPAGVDAMRVDGSITGGDNQPGPIDGMILRGFSISQEGGLADPPHGRYGLHLYIAGEANGIYNSIIDKVNIEAPLSYGMYLTNPGGHGFFSNLVENSLIENGIYWNKAGDHNGIIHNNLAGKNAGIYADFIPGAALLVVERNIIINVGCAMQFGAYTVSLRIINNEIETPDAKVFPVWDPETSRYVAGTYQGCNNAIIDIDGSGIVGASTWHAVLSGNSVQNVLGRFDGYNLRFNNSLDASANDNYFSRTTPAKDILVESSSSDTHIGVNRYSDRVKANILTDKGTRTSFADFE